MNPKLIDCSNLVDGDIFYINTDNDERNRVMNGVDSAMVGTDVILIVDDHYEPGAMIVNGGHTFNYKESDQCFKIGHYSSLLVKTNERFYRQENFNQFSI